MMSPMVTEFVSLEQDSRATSGLKYHVTNALPRIREFMRRFHRFATLRCCDTDSQINLSRYKNGSFERKKENSVILAN